MGIITENAVAITSGMIASESAQVKGKETESKRETREAIISDLSKGKTAEMGLRVLRNLVQSLASSGVDFAQDKMVKKAGHKVKDEYDLMFEGKEAAEDKIDIQSPNYFIRQANGKQQQKDGKGEQHLNQEMPAEAKALTKEYIEAYGKFLVSGSTEMKKKIEKLESELRSKGFSNKELTALKTNIKNSMRGEILSQIKESFINRIFVEKENSMAYVAADRGIDELLNLATENHRLGGEDFGGFKAGLENALREMVEETKGEVREHVREEVTQKFIEAALNKKVDEHGLKSLVALGNKVGFDEEAFLKDWQKRQDDLGLASFAPPQNKDHNPDGQKKEKSPFELSGDEEKDVFCNQLRAVYMQRAIKGDFMTALQTSFRMRKLKNGLIKLGFNIGDFKRIEKEGREVAVMRFKEMMEEVMAERATLYDLAGPALKLIETRLKTILSNLERLGSPYEKEEVDLLIEKADVKMHDLAMEELAAVQALLKAGPSRSAERKQMQLIKLIKRLRTEASITGPAISAPEVTEKT